MSIRKAVIPVAGYGTRFLPFTKSIPKEMLPIVDRPVIQYIVEEAVEAGIEEIILVTGYSKRAIEDYFDYNTELEYLLDAKGKTAEKQLIRDVSDIARFVYVRQKEQLGTGHAILQAKEVIGNDPFVVLSGDDIYAGKPSKLAQMVEAYNRLKAPVIFTMKRDQPGDGDRYGYVELAEELGNHTYRATNIVEKPGDAKRPSPFATLSCFILTPEIFPILEKQAPGKGNEIWLTEAVNTLAQQTPVYAIEGQNISYFDCGNKLEYSKAVVEFTLKRPDLAKDFANYLRSLSL